MTNMQEFSASLKGELTSEQARALQAYNQNLIDEFRSNQGKVSGDFAGAPLLLLNTVGAKSGLPRTTPLVFSQDGEHFVVIASTAGLDIHPDWYHNLLKQSQTTIEVEGKTLKVQIHQARGEERRRLYDQHAALMPVFQDYARKTEREIPVIVLQPIS